MQCRDKPNGTPKSSAAALLDFVNHICETALGPEEAYVDTLALTRAALKAMVRPRDHHIQSCSFLDQDRTLIVCCNH